MKLKHYMTTCAVGLMVSMGGSAQAALVAAYEDTSLGNSFQHTVNFTNVTATSASATIGTTYFNNIQPILKLFETDGTAGSVTLTEIITNNGASPWSSWSEAIWAEYQTNDANVYGPFNPSNFVSWTSASSDVAGISTIDSALGVLTFDFASPVTTGQSFTLTQSFNYSSNVFAVETAQIPGVPLPAALPLMLSGLFGMGAVARKKKNV